MKWWAWPIEKRARAWIVHCADMLEQAMLVEATPQERRLLWLAAVARLAPTWMSRFLPVDDLRVSLLEDFLIYIKERRSIDVPMLLQSDWDELEEWTRSFYWQPSALHRQMQRIKKRLHRPRNSLLRLFRNE
jgi:hypothetical protein